MDISECWEVQKEVSFIVAWLVKKRLPGEGRRGQREYVGLCYKGMESRPGVDRPLRCECRS